MFTGIVERGSVLALDGSGEGGRLTVAAPVLRAGVEIGASVAVNGVCLTVAATDSDRITADLMPETLRRSNLGRLGPGEPVNGWRCRSRPASGLTSMQSNDLCADCPS